MRLRHLLILTATLLSACASGGGKTSVAEVNERTGDSFVRAESPLRFAAERPGLSDVGKDYLLVAPVSVNGSVSAGQYLWFAVGTTLDRNIVGAPDPGFDRIVLVVDDVPMTFDLSDWDDTARTEPYKVSMKVTRSFASRITASQLERIANAKQLEAYVTNPDRRSPVYALVQGSPGDWRDY